MTRSCAVLLLFVVVVPLPVVAQEAPGPSIQAFIFGDVLFSVSDNPGPDAFKLGQMVGHANAILSDRVAFFAEVSVTGSNSGYGVAMERASLRYDFNDALKVGAGRFHTPISYWNTAFHHGLWLQGSVARPEAVRFGSRFVPIHFVGLLAEGNFTGTPIHYAAGFGNGRGTNIAAAGDGGDINSDRAFIASASVRPASLFGFRVGGAIYLDEVALTATDADERIASAHVVWNRGAVDAVAEFIDVSHTAVGTSNSTGSNAIYLQLGYRMSGDWNDVTPYVRWEDMSIDVTDIVFGGTLPDYRAMIAGVRYDFDDYAAVKAEYRREELGAASGTDALYLQASFAIPVSGG